MNYNYIEITSLIIFMKTSQCNLFFCYSYHSVMQCASSMITAFKELLKEPLVKLRLHIPGSSAASGDEKTMS